MEGKSGSPRLGKKTKIAIAAVLIAGVFAVVNMLIPKDKLSVSSKKNLPQLPVIGSYDNLEALLKKATSNQRYWTLRNGGVAMKSAESQVSPASDSAAGNGDFSQTNVQVQGVDEGDTVKNDGEFIYKIYNSYSNNTYEQGIQIIKAYPGEQMKLVKKLVLANIYPMQMFLNNDKLIVLGNGIYKPDSYNTSSAESKVAVDMMFRPMNITTVAAIYDIQDKQNPKLLRTIEVDGNLNNARMIGSNVYMISNKYIYMDLLNDEKGKYNILPAYKDSTAGGESKTIDLKYVKYCPEALEPNYIIVSSFNLDAMNKEVNVSSTLGSGWNIFCSIDNLYVAGCNYDEKKGYITSIYKFSLKNGAISFAGMGKVDGNILNQFSMDEYKGYFRVTTTIQPVTVNGNNGDSANNIYVLNSDMELVGKIEGLAAGERIYSTRFIGERAYMVTFKNTDPLYVIDLKNPEAPRILGELKIPGFSNYLHPYDENHIIGFGMDTETVNTDNREAVLQQGMKLALFDVSDVNHPKQEFTEVIGDRGTYSELLYNHKALLFSKEKNLLAFPITVSEIKESNNPNTTSSEAKAFEWGQPTFVGAYVYNIDLEKGFSLKGRVTHFDVNKSDPYNYDWYSQISRVLYIKDNIYTVSENYIMANNLSDMKETGRLQLYSK